MLSSESNHITLNASKITKKLKVKSVNITNQQCWCCTSSGWRRSRPREAVPCSPREFHCRQTPGRARCRLRPCWASSDVLPPAWWRRDPSGHRPRPARCGPDRLLPATGPTPEPWRRRGPGGLTLGRRTGKLELGQTVEKGSRQFKWLNEDYKKPKLSDTYWVILRCDDGLLSLYVSHQLLLKWFPSFPRCLIALTVILAEGIRYKQERGLFK